MAIYNVAAQQVWRNQVCVNVHHFVTTTILTAAQQLELSDGVRAAYALLDVGNAMDNAWSIENTIQRRVDIPGLPSAVFTFTSGPLAGTAAGANGLTNQASALISWYAPTVKPRRGRSYLPGFHSNNVTDAGFWDASALARMVAWANAIGTIALTGDTAAKAAVSYSGAPPFASLSNVFTASVVRSNPAVQRSRRIGSGV